MDKYLNIEGSEKILKLYGGWPSFHDSEILSVNLGRAKTKGKYGPTVTIKLHGFVMTNEIDDKGHYKTVDHAQIVFQFYDVVEFELTHGFGTQNPLSEVSIEDIRSHQLEDINYSVRFGAHLNCDVEFKCSSVTVASVVEGIPSESIYA